MAKTSAPEQRRKARDAASGLAGLSGNAESIPVDLNQPLAEPTLRKPLQRISAKYGEAIGRLRSDTDNPDYLAFLHRVERDVKAEVSMTTHKKHLARMSRELTGCSRHLDRQDLVN